MFIFVLGADDGARFKVSTFIAPARGRRIEMKNKTIEREGRRRRL